MPIWFFPLVAPTVSLLGLIFVVMMVARDRESEPLSWPMAIVCAAVILLLVWGIHDTPAEPAGWLSAAAIGVGFLCWGVWDQRAYLFGSAGPELGHVQPSGQSLVGNMLIAATEELLFRGFMQSSVIGIFNGPGGAVMALFAVNLAFALMHANRGMTFALSAGFFGMIMSMTVILSGSVWIAVATHVAWNLLVGLSRRRAAAMVDGAA